MATKRISKELQVRRGFPLDLVRFEAVLVLHVRPSRRGGHPSIAWQSVDKRRVCTRRGVPGSGGTSSGARSLARFPCSMVDQQFTNSHTTHSFAAFRTCNGTLRHRARQDRREMISFIGKRRSWGRVTVHTAAGCSSSPSRLPRTIPSSRPKSSSRPRCIIRTSTRRDLFVWIS